MKRIALIAWTGCILGCATGAPKWVAKGTSVFPPSEKVFYGLGQADPSIESRDLRAEAADNRARADLQKYFDTYTGYLMKEYDGPDGKLVERGIKTFSAGHLSGVRIADRYERDGKIYSLAKLDLDEFRKVMEKVPGLSEKARDFLRNRSAEVFEDLRKEEIRQGVVTQH